MNTEANSDEILNLDYNFSKLVCRALNRTRGRHELAARILGIGLRTIFRYKAWYYIHQDISGHWHAREFWESVENSEYGKSVNKKEGQEIGSMVN